MRTFAQKSNAPQQTSTAKSTKPSQAVSGQSHLIRSILHLQRTVGNQTVNRLIQSNAEEVEAGSITTAPTRYEHDFSRIPFFSKAPAEIQSKLTVSTPEDIYEKQADRVSDQVMRMPDLQPPTIPRGGNRITPSVRAAVLTLARSSKGRAGNVKPQATGERASIASPPTVRIHDDPTAHLASELLGAYAFTIGQDIYLGRGLGSGLRPSRDQVLRHEMVHVDQSRLGLHMRSYATAEAIEAQAHAWSASRSPRDAELLPADPEDIYGWWPLVLALAAGAYVLLRPNVANAPGPGDVPEPSVSELQVAGEAFALFLVPELVAGRIAIAGASGLRLLLAGSAAGSSALVSFRGVQDIGQGEFSGVGAYAADAAFGGIMGVWAYGPIRAFATGATGPRLYLIFAGSGAGMGLTARGYGDLRRGELSGPGQYLLWGGGGALLGLGGAATVRGLDVLSTRGLAASDLALSQRIASGGPFTAEELVMMYTTRPDLVGRMSLGYTEARGLMQVYRGQLEPGQEILSAFARAQGVERAEEEVALLLQQGLTLEDLASLTARFSNQPISEAAARFALPEELQHLSGQPLGAFGIPTSRLPGVAADFARTGGGTVAEGVAIQPTLYVIRIPRTAATPVGAAGYGEQSIVEMEQVLFNQLPPGSVVRYGPPPPGLPSLRAEYADEVGWTLIVPGP